MTLRDSDFGFCSVNYCLVRLGQPVRRDADWDSRRVGRCLDNYKMEEDKIIYWLWSDLYSCLW